MGRAFLAAVLAAALLVPQGAQAQRVAPWWTGESNPKDIRVSLLTFSPGDDIPSWFGHTALLVEDVRLGAQRVYNYGMFSFDADMLPKFLMGYLTFWVAATSYPATVHSYRAANRSVRKQQLNLEAERAADMAKFLAWNALPENRDYIYDHYADNCATRIRDVIDKAVGGALREATSTPSRLTYRGHTRRFSQHNPYIDFVLMLWMNKLIDQPILAWDDMFLPDELERQIDGLEYVNTAGERVPLVQRRQVLFAADRPERPLMPNAGWSYFALIGVFLAVVGNALAWWFARRRRRAARVMFGLWNALLGLAVGIPGLVLMLLWFTEHRITYYNENALMANAVTLALLPAGVAAAAGAKSAFRALFYGWGVLAVGTALAVLLKILPAFSQDNVMIIAFMLPLNMGGALAAALIWKPAWISRWLGRQERSSSLA